MDAVFEKVEAHLKRARLELPVALGRKVVVHFQVWMPWRSRVDRSCEALTAPADHLDLSESTRGMPLADLDLAVVVRFTQAYVTQVPSRRSSAGGWPRDTPAWRASLFTTVAAAMLGERRTGSDALIVVRPHCDERPGKVIRVTYSAQNVRRPGGRDTIRCRHDGPPLLYLDGFRSVAVLYLVEFSRQRAHRNQADAKKPGRDTSQTDSVSLEWGTQFT